jgi:ABC-type branched-subunit amino acid transport system substrate-binding protein
VRRYHLLAAIGLAAGGLLTSAWAGDFTPAEQRGKQLYVEGVGPDGTSPMATIGQGSVTLSATKVPCASCHGPDGLGRPEAGVIPSNITWANLTKPYGLRHDNGRSHPPYTPDAFVRAVTTGIDPAGNALDAVMPRYTLNEQAAHDLATYLKRLGTDSEKGVGEKEVVVAAVVPTGGRLAAVGNVVGRLLSAYFDRINRDGGIYNRQVVLKTAAFDSSGSAVDALRQLTINTDIFAVVAPIVLGQEVPFAEFSESAALPVIGPFAQHRRNERQDFTFYLMSGLDDQVRALVKYAQNDLVPDLPKIAILSSDDGANLSISEAIRQQSRNADWVSVLTLRLTGDTAMTDIASQLRLAGVTIIFYDGGPSRLVALTEAAARSGWRPAILTTSLAATSNSFAQLREADAHIFVAYSLLASDQSPEALQQLHSLQTAYDISAQHLPMQVAALVSARILVEGLQRGGRELTRAKFVAALAGLQNFETGLIPPISFGPNRRTGVRGAHVVALGRTKIKPEHTWISLD